MIDFILGMLGFGCRHKLGFPLTPKRGQRRPLAAEETGSYVVCTDCGKEWAYDWQRMKVLDAPQPLPERRDLIWTEE